MTTSSTSTTAVSSIPSAASRRAPRRLSKIALVRVKVATIIVAVALFIASLVGIAAFNPQVGSQAAVPAQVQQITVVRPGGSRPLVLSAPPSVSSIRPLMRSRGS